MEGFKVTTKIGQDDWRALVRTVQRAAYRRANPLRVRLAMACGWLGTVILIVILRRLWPASFNPEAMVTGALMFAAWILLLGWRQRRAMRPAEDGACLGTVSFDFRVDGFELSRRWSTTRYQWPIVRQITHTATHIFLWVDNTAAYPIRVADLPAPITMDDAVARLRQFTSGSASPTPT